MGISAVVAVGAASAAQSADASRRAGHAAGDATSAMTSAQDRAMELQKPWMDAGTAALQRLTAGYAKGGEFNAPEYKALTADQIQNDPGYQYIQKEAQKGLINAGSRGNNSVMGGKVQKALQDRSAGIASTHYDTSFNQNLTNWEAALKGMNFDINNLTDIANRGQIATNNTGNLILGQGQTQAQGIVGQANASNSADLVGSFLKGAGSAAGMMTGTGSLSGLLGGTSGSSNTGGGLTTGDFSRMDRNVPGYNGATTNDPAFSLGSGNYGLTI